MSVIAFENLKVTTMTLVIPLIGSVDLNSAFGLFKVTRVNLPQPKRQTQKYKIPYCADPGSIVSLRYKGCTRGIIRSITSDHFKHSITIDIATKEKNVSVKLSSTGMQMCGATSITQGEEAANYIIEQLTYIQDRLDYIDQHPELAMMAIEWLKDNTRGEITYRITAENSESNELSESTEDIKDLGAMGEIAIDRTNIDNFDDTANRDPEVNIKILNQNQKTTPDRKPIPMPKIEADATIKIPEEIPEEVDGELIRFLLQKCQDFIFHSDFCAEIDWITSIKTVITRPLGITRIQKAMVNYNYDLGFSINRIELARQINGLNGFFARYSNSAEHNVTIELPYVVPEEHKNLRRKNKKPCHTFLIYKSGLVTQSGPGEELMKDAYYRFNETINSIREHIIKPNIPRTLKYKPIFQTNSALLV